MKRKILALYLIIVLTVCNFGNGFDFSVQAKSIAWYNLADKISHAAGGYKKVAYTNSKEALKNTLKQNKKLIEIDFVFTSDNVLVARHGWEDKKNKPQTLKQYLKSKTNGGNTGMTAEEAIKMLAKKKNTYLIVDTREKDVAKTYKELYKICIKTNNKSYLKYIIPQFYSQTEYSKIKKVYKFKNWIFTLYKLKPSKNKEYKEIADFCKKQGIKVVTMPKSKVTKKRVNILKDRKLVVFTHTVNTIKQYEKLKKLGIKGIYTDFL